MMFSVVPILCYTEAQKIRMHLNFSERNGQKCVMPLQNVGLSSVNCKVCEVSWKKEQLKVLQDNRK